MREEHKLAVAVGGAVGLRSESVRRANLSAILRELHVSGPLSRSDLVARTGLTRSAIRALIGELVAARLVVEEPAARLGSPGRPSPVVRPVAERHVVLGLEIAVDSLAAARIGLGGEVLSLVRVDRPRGHFAPQEIVADLARLARRVMARRSSSPIGIGVAMVGVVRRYDGLVAVAPNLGWRDVPLGSLLEQTLERGLPVAVANEADLGALAELRRGAARGARNVLFVSGEVGVGGGLIVDGKPLTGQAGYAGEIGHIGVNPQGRRCGCGSVGCWETEVGERALLMLAGRAPDGGRQAVDDVLREAAAGSETAVAAVEGVAHWVGIGLAGLINVFNPELVVLGGLLGRLFPLAESIIQDELERRSLAATRELARVVPAVLGAEAPLLGAAELAFEPLLSDPARWLPRRESASAMAV
jgi:predicted NBD/HSP70 family sugar kinase